MTIDQLIDAGALFVANHSGGKDSQAQLIGIHEDDLKHGRP